MTGSHGSEQLPDMRQLPFVRRAPRALVVGVLAGGSFMLVAACGAEVTLPSTGSPSTSSGGASGSSGNSSGASGTAPGESDSGTTSGGLSIALGVSKLDLPVPGVAKVRVRVARTGWNGEVKVDLASAPNGVTAASVTVPAGSSEGDLVLQSAIILPPGAMATVRAVYVQKLAEVELQMQRLTALHQELRGSLQYLETCTSCSHEAQMPHQCCECRDHAGTEMPSLVQGVHGS